jgi:hypothetical protein
MKQPVPLDNEQFKQEPFTTSNLLLYCYWFSDDIFVKVYDSELNEWVPRPLSLVDGKTLLEKLQSWSDKMVYPQRAFLKTFPTELPHE